MSPPLSPSLCPSFLYAHLFFPCTHMTEQIRLTQTATKTHTHQGTHILGRMLHNDSPILYLDNKPHQKTTQTTSEGTLSCLLCLYDLSIWPWWHRLWAFKQPSVVHGLTDRVVITLSRDSLLVQMVAHNQIIGCGQQVWLCGRWDANGWCVGE